MKDILELMCEKIKTTEGVFSLKGKYFEEECLYTFMQAQVGDARFVYGTRNNGSDIPDTAQLVAIYADEKVYIHNNCYSLFPSSVWHNRGPIPKGTVSIGSEVGRLLEKLKTEEFQKFYGNLDTSKLEGYSRKPWELEKEARKAAFYGAPSLPKPDVCFTSDKLIKILCGQKTFEDCVKEEFEESYWLPVKARNETISALAENTPIQSWEKALHEALDGLDAVNVTVTFENEGVKATEKMAPGTILSGLVDNGYFRSWDFAVDRNGEKLMTSLNPKGGKLTCENIVKITYGKKTLYER